MIDKSRLRELFQELRLDEAGRAPAFEELLSRKASGKPNDLSKPHMLVHGFAFAALLLLVVGVGLTLGRPTGKAGHAAGTDTWNEVSIATQITQWRSPSDFLLETPGRELLDQVPEIGNPALLISQPQRPDPHPRSDP